MTRAKTQSTPSLEERKIFFFAPWRPFVFAQDRLDAMNFVEAVLLNI
jgi:hypothetical protein